MLSGRSRWITASKICILFSTSYESWIQSTYLSTWQAYLLLYFLQNWTGYDVKNNADRGECYQAEVDNSLQDLHIILHIIRKLNSINISKYLTGLSPLVLSSELWPISGYKQMFFFLDDTPQKVDRYNVHRGISMFCIFLHFFCSDLVRNSAILPLDRIIAESAICFSSLLPKQPRF